MQSWAYTRFKAHPHMHFLVTLHVVGFDWLRVGSWCTTWQMSLITHQLISAVAVIERQQFSNFPLFLRTLVLWDLREKRILLLDEDYPAQHLDVGSTNLLNSWNECFSIVFWALVCKTRHTRCFQSPYCNCRFTTLSRKGFNGGCALGTSLVFRWIA